MERVGRLAADLTGALGRRFLARLGESLDQVALLWRVIVTLVRARGRGRQIIRTTTIEQIYFTGIQALPVLGAVALLLGVLVIVESTERLSAVGLEEALGRVMVVMIIRELGPVMTALLVILRSGVAIGIKLGYMTALREMESIEMQGVDPLHLVAIPRIIGLMTAIVCLFIYFDVVAVFGGAAFAWAVWGIPLGRLSWVVSRAISFPDVAIGLVKAIFFGGVIGIIFVYRGMSAGRKLTAVAPQVSRAAVECLLWCLVLDVTISAFFYL